MSFDIYQITLGMVSQNEQCFNLFYQKYFHRLYRYLLVVTHGNEEWTQDILQEAMLRIICYIKPFKDPEIFFKWLLRVIRTTFIDELRKKKIDVIPLMPDMNYEQEQEKENILLLALKDVFEILTTDEKNLILQKYQEEKSHIQLAQEYQSTAKAIESKLARIRKKLRHKILEKLHHEL